MMPANVVARLKIPSTVIFQVAKAIADNVRKFEESYGPITPAPPDGSTVPPFPDLGTVDDQDGDDDDEHQDD